MNKDLKKLFSKRDKLRAAHNRLGEVTLFYYHEAPGMLDGRYDDYNEMAIKLSLDEQRIAEKISEIENQIAGDEKGEG